MSYFTHQNLNSTLIRLVFRPWPSSVDMSILYLSILFSDFNSILSTPFLDFVLELPPPYPQFCTQVVNVVQVSKGMSFSIEIGLHTLHRASRMRFWILGLSPFLIIKADLCTLIAEMQQNKKSENNNASKNKVKLLVMKIITDITIFHDMTCSNDLKNFSFKKLSRFVTKLWLYLLKNIIIYVFLLTKSYYFSVCTSFCKPSSLPTNWISIISAPCNIPAHLLVQR